MNESKYKVRNGNGTVIAQYQTHKPPEKPSSYEGEWNVEEADELNNEPVEWWDVDGQF